MPDDQIQFSIRIPKELHERLTRMAKAGYRSLNGEIVRILDTHTAPVEKGN